MSQFSILVLGYRVAVTYVQNMIRSGISLLPEGKPAVATVVSS